MEWNRSEKNYQAQAVYAAYLISRDMKLGNGCRGEIEDTLYPGQLYADLSHARIPASDVSAPAVPLER